MNSEKLARFKGLLAQAEEAYESETSKMDGRERLYRGDTELRPLVDGHASRAKTRHVRNIIAENLEAEVDCNIPQPKVTPRRAEDWERAKLIEDLIRAELDRLPMEELNDLMERMVPIQGGGFWLIEWDEAAGRFYRTGELAASVLHPKAVIPQDGVTGGVDEMDYLFLKQALTGAYVARRWGVRVEGGEDEPELRSVEDAAAAEGLVTVYTAYYRGDDGRIGRFVWTGERVLEDSPDFLARKCKKCGTCGAVLPRSREKILEMLPEGAEKAVCPYCGGSSLHNSTAECEEVYRGFVTARGVVVPGARVEGGALVPTKLPVYRPDLYPVVLQRNVTLYGRLLGDSDVDKIAPQQNALNWHMKKIDDRLLGAGSVVVLPKDAHVDLDPRDNRIWRVDSASDAAAVRVLDFASDLRYNFAQAGECYEAARNILGITDSYQGRKDTTATSGRAKEFSAAQAAGRLESKRMLKASAWARLFELIFKLTLACAREPRQLAAFDENGDTVYRTFDRFDFLERDAATGEYYWDDDFLFACDTAAPLASSRTAMWQECRELFASGAYGDVSDPRARVLFWTEMERLHHPLAGAARRALAEREGEGEKRAEFVKIE